MSGIINIILKKDKKRGVNGSFQVNTGWPHNHAASVNMNFRRDWVNLFVNYGIEYDQNPGGGNAFQEYRLQDTTFTTRQNRDHLRGGLSNNVRFGADFFLGEKSTLTTSFLYRYSNEENDTDLSFTDFNANGQLERYTLRNDIEIEGDENLEYAINYTRRFKREGHKLTADVQFQRNFETEDSDIVEISGPNRNEIISEQLQRVSNAEGEDRWMIQSDYIQPFGDGAKFETGFRFTLRNIDNEYLVEEQNDAGEFAELDTFTTDFSYNENVYAGYAILSKEYDRFSWQGGLRMESTDITGRLEEIDRDLAFNYTNFFPSAFLSYKLRNTNELQLSYSRRINRPRFRALNPFSSFTNNRNFRVGNPELQPEFTDSSEFGMLQNLESGTFYYGVYYRYTTDLIQRVQLEPDGIETVRTFENIGFARALGFELNVANDFTKWYRVSGNFNFFRNQVSGSYILADSTVDLGAEAITFTTRINNNFKFEGLFDGQLNINYQAPRNEAQGRRLSITSVDMGVTRDVFQKNGTLSLSVRDIFNSRKWRNITDIANYYEEGEWQWRRGPQFVVTLTYRLNQQKSRGRDRGEGRGDFDGGDGF
jgi:outer membrane receptor protein involved in Fe transport